MMNGRTEVVTSVERRRSSAEKQQLVLASLEPGASVSAVAREADADHRRGGRRGADDRGCGAGISSAAMIPVRFRGAGMDCDRPYRHALRGMSTLALLVQEALKRDSHGGDHYVFRGKSGKLIKILWHDGLGMSPASSSTGASASAKTPPGHGYSPVPIAAASASRDHAGSGGKAQRCRSASLARRGTGPDRRHPAGPAP